MAVAPSPPLGPAPTLPVGGGEGSAWRSEAETAPGCFAVQLHAAHGGCSSPSGGLHAQQRPQPLTQDLAHALAGAAEVQAAAGAAGPRGLGLLLQVQPDKETLLGWRLPGAWERPPPAVAAGGIGHGPTDVLPAEVLAGLTLCVRIPLLLAAAHRVDMAEIVELMQREEDVPVVEQCLVAVSVPPSASRQILQGLRMANATPAGPRDQGGTWLFECHGEGEQSALLEQLQLAGCLMQDLGVRYRMGELLGVGASSRVFLAEDVQTGEDVAVKIVSKSGPEKDIALLREATILRWATHPCVLHFRGIYEMEEPSTGQGAWGIVTEFVGGGELFEEVRHHGPLAEERACDVMRQLLSALDFLHHRGIVHRDIKTENVCKTGMGDEIKLVDFGLATPEWDAAAMVTRCGSPGYIAPEVLRGDRYGCRVDCFSVGVLMYILLAGYGPFRGQTMEEMLYRNVKCRVSLRGLAHCSEEAKDLVSRLLVPSGDDRPPADRCLAHPWFDRWPVPWGTAAAAAETGDMVAPAASEGTSGSGRSHGKGQRRRLFSEQLGYTDMFFKHLRFADELSSEGATGSMPPAALAEGPGRASAGAAALQQPAAEGQPPGPQQPQREQPAASKWPQAPQGVLHPHAVELQEPMETDASSLAAGAAAERPSLGAPPAEAPSVVSPPLTTDMFRTCEPLWAEVQRTLSNLRGQGLLPASPAKKGSLGMRQRGKFRRPPTDSEEPERFSAYFTRDVQQRQSFDVEERQTAFCMRDLGEANRPSFDVKANPDRGQEASFGASFGARFGCAVRPNADMPESPTSAFMGARPSAAWSDVRSEERTSAYFTRKTTQGDSSDDEEEDGRRTYERPSDAFHPADSGGSGSVRSLFVRGDFDYADGSPVRNGPGLPVAEPWHLTSMGPHSLRRVRNSRQSEPK